MCEQVLSKSIQMAESIFGSVEQGPPIEVFALNKAFLEDKSEKRINLGVGGKLSLVQASLYPGEFHTL